MKKLVRFLGIVLFASTFSPSLLAADNVNANQVATAPSSTTTTTMQSSDTTNGTVKTTVKSKGMGMSNLLQQLQKAGYTVKSADFDSDNGTYKVDAIDRHGESQSLDLNAATGLTPDQKKKPTEISMAQAVKKLEKGGAYVKSISGDASGYKATVVDKQGNSEDYTIDLTGKVSK